MQDGKTIPASERIAGRQSLPQVTEDLRKELAEDGIDLEAALRVEDDSLADLDNIPETGQALSCHAVQHLFLDTTKLLASGNSTCLMHCRSECSLSQ